MLFRSRRVAHLAVPRGKLPAVGDLRRALARVPDEATVMGAGVEAPDGTTGRASLGSSRTPVPTAWASGGPTPARTRGWTKSYHTRTSTGGDRGDTGIGQAMPNSGAILGLRWESWTKTRSIAEPAAW